MDQSIESPHKKRETRITRITIHGLFGIFDHRIPLNQDERITIIHGPNGVGKTTILKLLGDLFSCRFSALRTTPYRKLTVDFSPQGTLSIARKPLKSHMSLVFSFKEGKRTKTHDLHPSVEVSAFRHHYPMSVIEEYVSSLERVGRERWIDRTTGETLSLEEVLYNYWDVLPIEMARGVSDLPEWLIVLLGALPTHFIQTQRLFAAPAEETRERGRLYERRAIPQSTSTVEKYSSDMARRIQDALRESGAKAASLDRTFPHRLLGGKLSQDASEGYIRAEYRKQTAYRKRLMDAGLIDPDPEFALPQSGLSVNDRKVLWYYIKDVNDKLSVFDQLLQKVELFKDIINKRFLYKTFGVGKEKGFIFTTSKGDTLPLKALSSGEQHEIVLSYELLFQVQPKSLILIDEPELSLHVTWQHKFLEDIKRISELANLDFLIATHSPSIIHNRRDLMVRLGE